MLQADQILDDLFRCLFSLAQGVNFNTTSLAADTGFWERLDSVYLHSLWNQLGLGRHGSLNSFSCSHPKYLPILHLPGCFLLSLQREDFPGVGAYLTLINSRAS